VTKRPTITATMKLEVLRQYETYVVCDGCEGLIPLKDVQFDHHLALVDGGAHTVDNLRPLCPDCHGPKSAYEHKENCRAKRRAKKHRPKSSPETAKGRAGSEGPEAQVRLGNGNSVHGEHRRPKRVLQGRLLTDPIFKRKVTGQTVRRER